MYTNKLPDATDKKLINYIRTDKRFSRYMYQISEVPKLNETIIEKSENEIEIYQVYDIERKSEKDIQLLDDTGTMQIMYEITIQKTYMDMMGMIKSNHDGQTWYYTYLCYIEI